jgi:hypothetical protein
MQNGGYYVGSSSGRPVENVNNTDFSFMYVTWDNSIVEKNWIEEQDPDVSLQHPAGGIEVHASNSKAMGNTLIGTNPAFYLAAAPGPKEKITASDNEIRNSIRGIVFFLADGNLTDINVIHNSIELTTSSIKASNVCAGIIVPTGDLEFFDKTHANAGYVQRVNITDNTIFNNFSNKKLYPCDGMVLHSLHTAKVKNNNINGMTGTGIMFLGSPWGSQDVEISHNRIVDCGRAKPDTLRTSIYFSQSGSSKTPALPFHSEDIRITDNQLGNTDSRTYETSGITFAALGISKLKGLYVSHNIFSGVMLKLSDGHNEIVKMEALNPEAHFAP